MGVDMDKSELEHFIDKHDVIYIRHLMASNKDAYQRLISERIAAIHYGEDLKAEVDRKVRENHAYESNYKERSSGLKALHRLNGYRKTGAIIVADYSDPDFTGFKTGIKKTILVGILHPTSEDKPIWVERYDPRPEDDKFKDGLFYKQVALDEVIELGGSDLAMLLAIHPRGNTVIHWEEGEKAIKFIYRREKKLEVNTKSLGYKELFPAQQEVLCSEYLRSDSAGDLKIKYLLLPVGRGMKSIDIFGAGETKLVFAQVSFTANEDEIQEKIKALNDAINKKQDKDAAKVYFGPPEAESKVYKNSTDVKFVSMDQVVEAMRDSGILGDMLGIVN